MTIRMHRPAAIAAFFALGLGPATAQGKLTEVRFGTNWVAQAEHGGYYQAVVDGTYEKYGLKVTIVPGGPQANNRMLLPVGRIDFYMGGNMVQALSAVEENIPTSSSRRISRRIRRSCSPIPDRATTRSRISRSSNDIYRLQGRRRHLLPVDEGRVGFKEEQMKPYTFNPAPFIANKKAVPAGLSSRPSPSLIEKAGGFKPDVFLLADNGFTTYATTSRDAARNGREAAGCRAEVRRCLEHRLVQLSLRRQQGGQRAHQEGQSRDDRRADRLLHRQDEGIRHRRFRAMR